MQIYPEIYKKDSKGKTRTWRQERDGDKYRTVAGILDGNLVTSEWKLAEPTNVGKANERMGDAQADFEIQAKYKHKLKREYHENIEDIDQGAHIFEVMLAGKYNSKKFKPGYAQPKLDGIRCIATKDGLFSRGGEKFEGLEHIWNSLAETGVWDKFPEFVSDGELYNHDYRDKFDELKGLITRKKKSITSEIQQKIVDVVQYHVYDFPTYDEIFGSRFFTGCDVLESVNDNIVFVETVYVSTSEEYDNLHIQWVQLGNEGSMWREDSLYQNKRSKFLLKRKDFDDDEFEIAYIEEGKGNWKGAAKRVVCWLQDADKSEGPTKDNTFGAGVDGSYDRNVMVLIAGYKYATIRYFGFTSTDIPKPRFGVAKAFYIEKRTT